MRLVELRPALALCVILASAVPAGATVGFTTTEDEDLVDSVENPQAITLADVDGDNFDDLIVVEVGDSVSVFINNQDGTFDLSDSYDTVGEGPVAVATGLFNADNFVDIVTVNNVTGSVTIFLNDGEGFFDSEADPRQFGVGPNPVSIAVADFNNDTEDDLAVLSADRVFLLQGAGDGTFSAFVPATITNRFNNGFIIRAARIDPGNSDIDLVVDNRSPGQLATFLGGGDGTFTFNGSPNAGVNLTGFVIADANNDTNNDLIVADSEGVLTTELGLLLNDGDGVFPNAEGFTGPESPYSITALDVEPDGLVDLAVTTTLDDQIFLLCQPSDECVEVGAGGLEAGIWRPGVGGTVPGCQVGGQFAIAAGKLNDDDKDDLVALNGDLATICISLNVSKPGKTPIPTPITPGVPTPTPTGPSPTPTATRPPTATPTPTEVPTIGLGVCNTKNKAGFPTLQQPVALAASDFDQNGIQDVAVADTAGNRVVVLLDKPFGASDPNDVCAALNVQLGGEVPVAAPKAVLAADLDVDGKADLAAIGAEGLYVFYGNGSGAFTPASANPISAGVNPSSIALADLNRNLTPDLIVTDSSSTNVSIFLGTRQRAQPFTGPCAMPVQGRTNAAVSTDLNNDGRNDFAVTSPQSRNIAVFLQVTNAALACGNMAASFQGQTTLSLPGDPVGLVAGTFGSNDTIPDLVVAMTKQSANGTVLLFQGQVAGSGVTYQRGTETLVPTPVPAANFTVPSAIGTGDIERDGRTDLLITDQANNNLTEFRGQSSGGLGAPLIPEAVLGDGPADLLIVDLDGDGRADVVVANALDGSLSYMLSEQRAPTPTPVPTNTPTVTTTPQPPPGTPTSTPTITPTPTRSRRPSSTPTPVPTKTQRGQVTLSGNGCAIDEGTNGPGTWFLAAFAMATLVIRRRATRLQG